MGVCPGCGARLPEACPKCPPQVINCPYCGSPCLIEAMAGAQMDEILRERRNRAR